MEDLEQIDNFPKTIHEDNIGCAGMSTNLVCKRDIKYHFIRDFVERLITQPALLTKSLDNSSRSTLFILNIHIIIKYFNTIAHLRY